MSVESTSPASLRESGSLAHGAFGLMDGPFAFCSDIPGVPSWHECEERALSYISPQVGIDPHGSVVRCARPATSIGAGIGRGGGGHGPDEGHGRVAPVALESRTPPSWSGSVGKSTELARNLGRGLVVVNHQGLEVSMSDDSSQLQYVQLFREPPDGLGTAVVEVNFSMSG